MSNECKGVVDGRCCCNCSNQVKVFKHPLNKGEAKGGILDLLGYGCKAYGDVIFMDRKHGMCEEHNFKSVLEDTSQTKMYSEQDVEKIFNIGQMGKNYGDYNLYTFKESLEQFNKNK
jgi:hypothetical protein